MGGKGQLGHTALRDEPAGTVLAVSPPAHRQQSAVSGHFRTLDRADRFGPAAAMADRRSPYVVTAIRRLQTLRLLHVCSGRFRLERSPGGACTHWKSAALSRRTW